jgi:hypothetical protein
VLPLRLWLVLFGGVATVLIILGPRRRRAEKDRRQLFEQRKREKEGTEK